MSWMRWDAGIKETGLDGTLATVLLYHDLTGSMKIISCRETEEQRIVSLDCDPEKLDQDKWTQEEGGALGDGWDRYSLFLAFFI